MCRNKTNTLPIMTLFPWEHIKENSVMSRVNGTRVYINKLPAKGLNSTFQLTQIKYTCNSFNVG